MRTTRRAIALVMMLIGGLVGAVATAPPVLAATITAPTGNPFIVPGNAAGQPQAFTVSASGFVAGDLVFVEQCDGVAVSTPGWDPSINCDLGTSPAAAIASATGTVTFPTTDVNRRFQPFKGPSPQGQFNCLGLTDPSPNNGLPNFTNCKIRVSTNNSASTSDQVFLNIRLPNSPAAAPNFTGTPGPATVGFTYSFGFSVTGSPAPTFTMSPPSVAGGITVSTGGVLGGIPTTAGSFPITVTATNGIAPARVRSMTLVVVAPTPSSRLQCGMRGALGLSLSDVPPKKAKAIKVKSAPTLGTAAGGSCATPGVPASATKFPITAGAVKLKGSLPAGSNCSSLATLPLGGTLKIKWQGINPKKNALSTAGKSLAGIRTVTTIGPDTYEVSGPITSGVLSGATMRMTLRTSQTHAARLAQCRASRVGSIAFAGTSVFAIV
jgi:hypothetical protein